MDLTQNTKDITKKGDFVELKFTGLADGNIFDSNISQDLKKLDNKAIAEKTIVIIGQGMVIKGFDDNLEGKELNKEYNLSIHPKEAFGLRKTEFVRTMPIKIFHQQKIQPVQGASFLFDNQLARVIAVSGARITADFNNPLAGKEISYKFTIIRIVKDIKEKAETVCKLILRHVPEIEIIDETITLKGPKILESFINQSQSKFKEFLGKEVLFKEVETKKSE